LALFVMVGILGAAISTIDSILLTLSSMFARDLYRGLSRRVSEEMELRLGKWVIPVVSGVAMVFGALRLGPIARGLLLEKGHRRRGHLEHDSRRGGHGVSPIFWH
jgi:Na+/proline symporter